MPIAKEQQNDISTLSAPLQFPFSGKIAKNKIMKTAMSEVLSHYDHDNKLLNGRPTEKHFKLYEEWGRGNLGVIITGNIAVHREALEARGNMIIDYNITAAGSDYTEDYRHLVNAAKVEGALLIGQLSHAGRQTATNITLHPVGPSDLQLKDSFGKSFGKPRTLTEEDIKDIVYRFGYAAKVLHTAGADGIQLHGAHGYLLTQFLSPLINTRTDKYGGSLENRARIVFEIFDEIRHQVNDPTFIVGIKLNSQDHADGGFSEEEASKLIQMLEVARADFIEISGGTYEKFVFFEDQKESTKRREAFFLEFSARVKPHIKKSLIVVTGGFRHVSSMAAAIRNRECDIIGIARPLTANPHFVKRILPIVHGAIETNLWRGGVRGGTRLVRIRTQ